MRFNSYHKREQLTLPLLLSFRLGRRIGVLPRLDATTRVGYASSAMHSDTGLWLGAALFTFTFFVIVPSIAAVIGYAAWKGRAKHFDREMYWTASAAASGVSPLVGQPEPR